MKRIDNVRKALLAENLDCCIITDVKNVYYLTGFLDISNAVLNMLIPQEGKPTLLVTSLSAESATSQADNCDIKVATIGKSMDDFLIEELKYMSVKKVGYDTLQLQTYLALSKSLDAKFYDKVEIVANQRRIKNSEEISLISRSCKMADEGMKAAIETIRPGVKEVEVAAQAEYAMRMHGSLGAAFETLVASGPRSAFPHGISSDKKILEGELVTVDLGATCKGYCSDLTRTVIAGKPSRKALNILKKVLEVHDKVLEEIHPRAEAAKIDAFSRTIFGSSFMDYFIHGLGHGVGLAVHEAPTLSRISKDILEAGNVVTDEPGIYIHGYGGARIEDTVLVTREGCNKLTKFLYP